MTHSQSWWQSLETASIMRVDIVSLRIRDIELAISFAIVVSEKGVRRIPNAQASSQRCDLELGVAKRNHTIILDPYFFLKGEVAPFKCEFLHFFEDVHSRPDH